MTETTRERKRQPYAKKGDGPKPRITIRLPVMTRRELIALALKRGLTLTELLAPVLAELAASNAAKQEPRP